MGRIEPAVPEAGKPEYASQLTIFSNVTEDLVRIAVSKGTSAAVLLYGAPQSGQDFTLIGDRLNRGLLPLTTRSLMHLLLSPEDRSTDLSIPPASMPCPDFHKSTKYKLYLSACAVYKDQVFDLYESSDTRRPMSPDIVQQRGLEALTHRRVSNTDAAMNVIEAAKKRVTSDMASHAMDSTLTHQVYTITIDATTKSTATQPATSTLTTSFIHFVHLAPLLPPWSIVSASDAHKAAARAIDTVSQLLKRQRASGMESKAQDDLPERSISDLCSDSLLTQLLKGHFADPQAATTLLSTINATESTRDDTMRTLQFVSSWFIAKHL